MQYLVDKSNSWDISKHTKVFSFLVANHKHLLSDENANLVETSHSIGGMSVFLIIGSLVTGSYVTYKTIKDIPSSKNIAK